MSEAALATARSWLGTPYRHQASARGVGADCLGLVRGVWRETVGPEPETVPAYTPDWAEMGGAEALLEALGRRFVRREIVEARPGDVVVFRMAEGAPAKHCGVLAATPEGLNPRAKGARMIHAYWGRAVVESWVGDWWAFNWIPRNPGDLDGWGEPDRPSTGRFRLRLNDGEADLLTAEGEDAVATISASQIAAAFPAGAGPDARALVAQFDPVGGWGPEAQIRL